MSDAQPSATPRTEGATRRDVSRSTSRLTHEALTSVLSEVGDTRCTACRRPSPRHSMPHAYGVDNRQCRIGLAISASVLTVWPTSGSVWKSTGQDPSPVGRRASRPVHKSPDEECRRDDKGDRLGSGQVFEPPLAGPCYHSDENRGAENQSEEASASDDEETDRSESFGSGFLMPFLPLTNEGFFV